MNKSDMIYAWLLPDDLPIYSASRVFVHTRRREGFGQLWDYERETWARRFFENWRASLKWQRLEPYEKFAQMIDRH